MKVTPSDGSVEGEGMKPISQPTQFFRHLQMKAVHAIALVWYDPSKTSGTVCTYV